MIPRLLLLAFAAALAACSGCLSSSSGIVTCTIDPAFTAEEREAIGASLDAWQDASGGKFFCLDDHPRDGYGNIDIRKAPTPPGEMGRTDFRRLEHIESRVNIRPGMTTEQVQRVSLHELGHALGLRYSNSVDPHHCEGPEPSALHPTYGDSSPHLEAVDLAALNEALP